MCETFKDFLKKNPVVWHGFNEKRQFIDVFDLGKFAFEKLFDILFDIYKEIEIEKNQNIRLGLIGEAIAWQEIAIDCLGKIEFEKRYNKRMKKLGKNLRIAILGSEKNG